MGHDYARNYFLTAVSLAILLALTGCGSGAGGPSGSATSAANADARISAEAAIANPEQVHLVATIAAQETAPIIDAEEEAVSALASGAPVAASILQQTEMVACHDPADICKLTEKNRAEIRDQYKGIKSVFVNIEAVELKVRELSGGQRLVLVPQVAVVDLLDLMKGVQISLEKVSFSGSIELQHIRFVLAAAGHYIEYENGKAILCISAHWLTDSSWVTRMAKPKTIHDFYGVSEELFAIQYPAPGSAEIADLVCATAVDPPVHADTEMWGLDHGSWSVLRHIFPAADVPVLQLSVNISQPAEYHFKLGQQLKALREHGVMIVASGNIVHNLRAVRWEEGAVPYDWASTFDEWVKSRLELRDFRALVEDFRATEAGKLAVPSPDHYYPLLYALGAASDADQLRFLYEGIQNGSVSMRTFSLG